MGRGILALYTQDSRYANAFMDYCSRNEKDRISVKAFTNGESLQGYITNHDVDILLVERELANEIEARYRDRLVVLTDEKYVNADEQAAVYKLQRTELVFRQIYQVMAHKAGRMDAKCISLSSQTELIGVFSPCCAVEREQFARMLATAYGDSRKVLFVNMAEFTEHDCNNENGVSELLYYLKDEEKSISYKLQTLVDYNGNYASLPGVKHYRDLHEMDAENVHRLLRQLQQDESYKTIIIDIGFLNDTVFSVLQHCSRIWMPVSGEERSNSRVTHMWHDFGLEGRDSLHEELISIELPDWWHMREGMRLQWINANVCNRAV